MVVHLLVQVFTRITAYFCYCWCCCWIIWWCWLYNFIVAVIVIVVVVAIDFVFGIKVIIDNVFGLEVVGYVLVFACILHWWCCRCNHCCCCCLAMNSLAALEAHILNVSRTSKQTWSRSVLSLIHLLYALNCVLHCSLIVFIIGLVVVVVVKKNVWKFKLN